MKEQIAMDIGKYGYFEKFNGVIMWGGTEGVVRNACFELCIRGGRKIVDFHHGTWLGGMWSDGLWQDGEWRKGTWNSGVWLCGIWRNGEWKGGIWVSGRCDRCIGDRNVKNADNCYVSFTNSWFKNDEDCVTSYC